MLFHFLVLQIFAMLWQVSPLQLAVPWQFGHLQGPTALHDIKHNNGIAIHREFKSLKGTKRISTTMLQCSLNFKDVLNAFSFSFQSLTLSPEVWQNHLQTSRWFVEEVWTRFGTGPACFCPSFYDPATYPP